MASNKTKNTISKDILLYLPAKIMEGVIGIITLSIYTELFAADVYGHYVIINPIISVTYLCLLGWLMHASFRYVNDYKQSKDLRHFCSTTFFVWLGINGLILLIVLITYSLGIGELYRTPISILLLLFASYSSSQILLSTIVALKKIKLNLLLSLCAVTFKLLLTLLFVHVYDREVIAIFLSHSIVDLSIALFLVVKLKIRHLISFKTVSKQLLKKMLSFGYPLIGITLTMSILTISDRYVIEYFYGKASVGIYTANYTIISSVFTMLMVGIMRGVYPNLLMAWKEKDKKKTEKLLSQGITYYVMIALPAAIGLTLLAKHITMLLAKEYQIGYSIIGWVAFGMFFLGLTEYCNKSWELTSKTTTILFNCLGSSCINLILNILLIPRYGYSFAAVTTFGSFIVYFIASYISGRKVLNWKIRLDMILKIVGSAGMMSIFILLFKSFIRSQLIVLFVVILAAMIVYFACLYVTGAIKSEVNTLFQRLKRSTANEKLS